MNQKFKERLRREVNLAIQEMRDGCLDCRKCKGLCNVHQKEATHILLNPRKHLNLQGEME